MVSFIGCCNLLYPKLSSNSEYEEKMIDQNFIALAESDFANTSSDEKQRIHDTVMKLWKSNSIKTLKGV